MEATEAIRGETPVTWVPPEKLHITLQFLGEADTARAGSLGDALDAAVRGARPFEILLSGGGAFPDLQHPRVLWIGVERHPALELLANDVARAMARFGFEPELRPFHPHITVGRAAKDAPAGALSAVAGELAATDYASVIPVERVDLMESMPGGAYRTARRVTLGGG